LTFLSLLPDYLFITSFAKGEMPVRFPVLRSHHYLPGALTVFILTALLLSGCGSKESSGKADIVITLNNGAKEGEEREMEEQRRIEALFIQKYPGARLYNDPWQFSPETFMVRMSGGTCTDVVGVFATEAMVVIEKGLAADITDLFTAWDKYPCINKTVLAPITYEGRIYGMPVGGVSGGYVMNLFYNKDLFREAGIERPPDTWEEFVAVAKKLTDRSRNRGGFGILGEKGAAGWHFLNWGWQAGGEFEKRRGNRWVAVFDSPEVITALQFIKDLRWKHDVLQDNLMCNNDELFEYFSTERIGMALFTPEYLRFLIDKYQMPFEKIGISLLPAGPGGRANQMGGAYHIINPAISEEQKKWAFTAIAFNYDLDTIELRCRTLKEQERIFGWGTIPVFHGEHQDKIEEIIDRYRTMPGQKELMQEAAKYVRPEPPYYCQQLYHEFLGPSVQAVLTDRNADPEILLKKAAADFQKRYLDKIEVRD